MNLRGKIDRYFFEPATPVGLYCMRLLVFIGGAIFFAMKRSLHPATFYDVWNPISFYVFLPGPLPSWILESARWVWLICSVAAGFGLWFRASAALSFCAALFFLGYEYCFNQVYHSVHIYIMTLGILAFARAPHSLFLSKLRPESVHGEFRWPLRWIQLYVVYVFFLCGLQKLYFGGWEWVFSDNFYIRLLINPYHPPLNEFALHGPLFISQVMAFLAFYLELLSPLALINKRWALAFVIMWTLLHVNVTATFGTHTQFFSQCFAYAAFLDWDAIASSLRGFYRSKIKRPNGTLGLF